MLTRRQSVVPFVVCVACTGLAAAGPAVPPPGFVEGEQFVFTAVHPATPAGTEQVGDVVVVTSLLPYEQTVAVVEGKPCGAASCLTLEAHRSLPDYGLGERGARNAIVSRASLDAATGELIGIDQSLLIAGLEKKTWAQASRLSTFADFYGPWMLELRPGYRKTLPLGDGRERSDEVVRQEEIDGRNAFVVKRRVPQPDGRILETTYWVDVERRFALQVEQDGWRMTLQSSFR